ncbi:hypothetical protein AB3329_01865 [Streptococcus sp. H31]|uniref:hypothetical protein n=1 Tax=Streptococcus huangxiaojuni TaxID=3237239 RepID=UPI0034A500C3
MMVRAYMVNPTTRQGAWFDFPLYFGQLTRIGHSGSYDEMVEIREIDGTDRWSVGLFDLNELEQLNRIAEFEKVSNGGNGGGSDYVVKYNSMDIVRRMLDLNTNAYDRVVEFDDFGASSTIFVMARFINSFTVAVDYYIGSDFGKEIPERLFAKCFVNSESEEVEMKRGRGFTYIEDLESVLRGLL